MNAGAVVEGDIWGDKADGEGADDEIRIAGTLGIEAKPVGGNVFLGVSGLDGDLLTGYVGGVVRGAAAC